MTGTTAQQVRKCARRECANYDLGYCLMDDAPCRVVTGNEQAGYEVACSYFLKAVLPLDIDLMNKLGNQMQIE